MKSISGVADDICDGKLVLSLGPSFAPGILTPAWQLMISAMLGIQDADSKDPCQFPEDAEDVHDLVREMTGRVMGIQKKYWKKYFKGEA